MGEAQDVIDVLLEDHRLLRELLIRLDDEDRPAEMRRLFFRIAGELAAHEAAEDQIVVPAGLAAEHDEVNSLMTEMLRLNPAGFGFLKRASALVVELQDHLDEEEEVLFPLLRQLLSPAALVELALQVRMARRVAPIFPQTLRRSVQSTQLIPLTDR